ncbi:Kinesin-like protein [Pseudocercospora fuligena]|uniref:Kinesin-like protein n=1 Tax=Pseudocercospora fuligena TaxID=685502 RepID=A0A8H6RPF4_9PEZI|nr:Kinesin-like protein [Pseudocercospora fuligena]
MTNTETTPDSNFDAFVRWRPPMTGETYTCKVEESFDSKENKFAITLSSSSNDPKRSRPWKSGKSFTQIFSPSSINSGVYKIVAAPKTPLVMAGLTCNFLAYGHSGSGKTHTIIGYEYQNDQQLGLCLAAARDLFAALDAIQNETSNEAGSSAQLGVGVRLYEVRGKNAYDLFNGGLECHIREGSDGQTHVRGQTEIFEDGRVRVRPIKAISCWKFEEVRTAILKGLATREVGSSSVHDQSSRTHAILELEVINEELVNARNAVIERESELVPVGKRATDIYLDEQMKSLIRTPEGQYVENPERPLDRARIDAAEAEKKLFGLRVQEAEEVVAKCFESCPHSCLGGKFVFVDLAGAEYFELGDTPASKPKQTPSERLQGRQINTDLLALKEVIRARAMGHARIPFRSSPLTMVLRSHFVAERGESAVVLTVSPSDNQLSATLNTLKYGDLVGSAGAASTSRRA